MDRGSHSGAKAPVRFSQDSNVAKGFSGVPGDKQAPRLLIKRIRRPVLKFRSRLFLIRSSNERTVVALTVRALASLVNKNQ
jgi:hypothetical protein